MTLASTTSKVQYNGNGSTTAFPFSFKFTAASEIEVILTSSAGVDAVKTITTHYTLSSPGDSGMVTMITAPASGEVLTIRRIMPLTQTTDLNAGGGFSAATIEAALDKLSMIGQQLLEKIRRAAKFRDGSTTSEVTLPEPSASAVLAWNSGGTDLENKTLVSLGAATFPASATDNAVPRFDGTGGSSLQNSGVTIDDSNNVAGVAGLSMTGSIAGAVNVAQTGYTDISEISTPGNPASNVYRLFSVDSGGTTRLRTKDASGNVRPVDQVDIVVFDGVGDDSTDDGPALQTALDNAGGRTVRLVPGRTYRIATAVVTRGKSWTIDARGARIHVDANINALTAYADIDNLQSVSAISGAEVTASNGAAFAAGDHVRVISEDTPVNARSVGAGDTYKSGEPCIVKSISGNILTMESSLIHGAAMTTTRRIYRMPLEEQVRIVGGEWYYTEGHDATPWVASMITLFGLIAPRIEGVRITRGYGAGVALIGTQSAYVSGLHAERLTDNTGNGQFGYGLADAGYGTTCVGITGESVRHLVTTNPLVVPAATTDEDQLHKYGHSRGLRVLGGVCMGASNVAFDTHHSTENVLFAGLYAQNCPYAVQIRAQMARVVDVEGRGITTALVRVASDNTDTPATEAGWAADAYIDNIFGDGAALLDIARAKNVHIGRVKTRLSSWRAITAVDAEVFLHENINLIIADTASTHAGRGVIDCDDVNASFTPTVEQRGGRIKVSGSDSSGSATFAAIKSDASSVIVRDLEVQFPNGSTGPMLITDNSGTIEADIKFDISGAAETGMTLTSGSNISANVESNDGLNDSLSLRRRAREPLKWLAAGTPDTATIASGVITATASFMTIDTESSAATDDLDTINEGVNGDILILRTANSGRDIVIKNGTGNITCGVDRVLSSISDRIVLMNTNGTAWILVAHFSNAGNPTSATQSTNKSTAVTINALSGQITMNNAALNANTTVSFTLTNNCIAANDHVVCEHISGGTLFNYSVVAVAGAGSATVSVRNITAGSLSDAVVLKFHVLKAA